MKSRHNKLIIRRNGKILQIFESKVSSRGDVPIKYRVHFMIDQEDQEGFITDWTFGGLKELLQSCDADGYLFKSDDETAEERMKAFRSQHGNSAFWKRKSGTYVEQFRK